jgi:hypothetical protein
VWVTKVCAEYCGPGRAMSTDSEESSSYDAVRAGGGRTARYRTLKRSPWTPASHSTPITNRSSHLPHIRRPLPHHLEFGPRLLECGRRHKCCAGNLYDLLYSRRQLQDFAAVSTATTTGFTCHRKSRAPVPRAAVGWPDTRTQADRRRGVRAPAPLFRTARNHRPWQPRWPAPRGGCGG